MPQLRLAIYKKLLLHIIKTRIEVLRAANNLTSDIDMAEVERESYEYYRQAFQDDTHTAYLVFDDDKFVGSGGISYYQVMPTYHNPSGKKAYIMNMYTRPSSRRNGIAIKTLALLVEDAKKRGIHFISLEATEMGRPLYEKFGFVKMSNEMEYIEILRWNMWGIATSWRIQKNVSYTWFEFWRLLKFNNNKKRIITMARKNSR